MSTATTYYEGDARHPFGLPQGAVRSFFALLITSFFWIVLLMPEGRAFVPPLGHFVLLSLVFAAFVGRHHPEQGEVRALPWLLLILAGTAAVVVFVYVKDPDRLTTRLTPNKDEASQLPLLMGVLFGGYGVGAILGLVLGPRSNIFQTLRAWIGMLAGLLLIAETVFQFAIRPGLPNPPSAEIMNVWEAILIAPAAAYFGTRAV
jgi:hypothetical protein